MISGSPFFTGTNPYGLAIAPSGSFLYTANILDNSISEFTINPDGSLTELSSSPIGEAFSGPLALFIDKSGAYLYVANQGSTNLAGYSIGSDGSLTLLTTSPFATASAAQRDCRGFQREVPDRREPVEPGDSVVQS